MGNAGVPAAVATALVAVSLTACGGAGDEREETGGLGRVASPVVATRADETSPSAAPGHLAWTRGSTDAPVVVMKLGVVLLRRDGRAARRVSPPHVLAASGGMDTQRLVIQTVRSGQSDLELVRLVDRRPETLPAAVNTRRWEWRGSISGRRLLFGRFDTAAGTYEVLLADLGSGRVRVLDTVRGHGAYAEPGQVSGRYATWAGCPDNTCSIYRYDITTERRVRVASDYRRPVYAPSVAADGTVYFGRGERTCGSEVKLMRWTPKTGPQVVRSLPTGADFRFTSTVQTRSGHRILLDGGSCSDDFDVFALTDRPHP